MVENTFHLQKVFDYVESSISLIHEHDQPLLDEVFM